MNNTLFGICAFLLVLSCGAVFPFENEDWETGDIFLRNNGTGDSLFYYLVRARNRTSEKILVIWLNGGPGSSSASGLFLENGPYQINRTGQYNYNPFSWNNEYDVLYVDQPPGTGFSLLEKISNICSDEICIARNFYIFLSRFYEMHPEYKAKRLYITGESYAGHYIPAIAAYLLHANNSDITLKGIGIGNGYTDMETQAASYPTYLYESGLTNTIQTLLGKVIFFFFNIAIKMKLSPFTELCTPFIDYLPKIFNISNPYNVKTNDTYRARFIAFARIVSNSQVLKIMKVEGRKLGNYSGDVAKAMKHDESISLSEELRYVTDSGITVLQYFGEDDYICNWIGGQVMAESIKWKGQEKFKQAGFKDWKIGNEIAGRYRKADNYIFLVLKGAGHLVPMELPYNSLVMLRQLVNNNFT